MLSSLRTLAKCRGVGSVLQVLELGDSRKIPPRNFPRRNDPRTTPPPPPQGLCLKGRGAIGGSPRAVAERSRGMCRRLREAVSGGWECGWGLVLGYGNAFGVDSVQWGGGKPPPPSSSDSLPPPPLVYPCPQPRFGDPAMAEGL